MDAKILPLPAGDIMLEEEGHIMLIERKTAGDLLNSITNGRLVNQGSAMVKRCELPLVLSHGSLLPDKDMKVVADGRPSRYNWFSLQMAIVSLQAGGVMYLHTSNKLLTDTIKYLQQWLRKDSHLLVSKREPLPFLTPMRGQQILASLPRIGMEKASDCLKYYGKAGYAIAELTHEDGVWPKGVGIKTVQAIRKGLGFEKNEWLEVVHELEG